VIKRSIFLLAAAGWAILLTGCSPDRDQAQPETKTVAVAPSEPPAIQPRKKSRKTPEEKKPDPSVVSDDSGANAPAEARRPAENARREASPAIETPESDRIETPESAPEKAAEESPEPPVVKDSSAAKTDLSLGDRSNENRAIPRTDAPQIEAPKAIEAPAPPKRHAETSAGSARLAIIIDDIGMSASQLTPFFKTDADLTFSIIPETRQAKRCLSLIRSHGRLPLLHLPMEPIARKDLLPSDGITTDLSDAEIQRRVKQFLDELPGVRGVNNHMGSKATQDSRVMESVLDVVKERGLFFVDSKTVQDTVVGSVAGRIGVPNAARTGEFLDDGGDTSRVYQILLRQGEEAKRNGSAIAIGHPHPGTAKAIARALPELEAMGVRIVPVSDLVR
jgi:polysaccharide deacetylase 2 family uncharacterized protein YibQ